MTTTKNNSIDTTCGIYNTEATITRHRDGTCTVRVPLVSWDNNTGTLAFSRVLLVGRAAKVACEMFDNDRTWNHDQENLWDLCEGNYTYLPRPILHHITARRQISNHGCGKRSIQLFGRKGELLLDRAF